MAKKPLVWTIAGSDSGSGAGIQADLLTCHDLGVHACTVITALTAQNSVVVNQIEYASAAIFCAQIDTLQADLPPTVIKLGMMGSTALLCALAQFLSKHPDIPIICDPVMVTSSGSELLPSSSLEYFMKHILPKVHVLTPNIHEAAVLTGKTFQHQEAIEDAARLLCQYGAKSALVKGGDAHSVGELSSSFSQDFWTDGRRSIWLTGHRQKHFHNHGSGCSLASAITACLAQGYTLMDALVMAKAYVTQGIRLAEPCGKGPGPVAHAGWPNESVDFPWITRTAQQGAQRSQFPNCGPEPLGFYPIVESVAWLEKCLSLGVKTIQLRIKNTKSLAHLKQAIRQATALVKNNKTRLFINDHWALAIEYGAYGVHLGQADLNTADIKAIEKAGLRLGISTHCYEELARAKALRPSYIAYGPIYHTLTASIPFSPRGTLLLKQVCELMRDYPVVAIGGVTYPKLADIYSTGVNGVATISAIKQANDLATTVKNWLAYDPPCAPRSNPLSFS